MVAPYFSAASASTSARPVADCVTCVTCDTAAHDADIPTAHSAALCSEAVIEPWSRRWVHVEFPVLGEVTACALRWSIAASASATVGAVASTVITTVSAVAAVRCSSRRCPLPPLGGSCARLTAVCLLAAWILSDRPGSSHAGRSGVGVAGVAGSCACLRCRCRCRCQYHCRRRRSPPATRRRQQLAAGDATESPAAKIEGFNPATRRGGHRALGLTTPLAGDWTVSRIRVTGSRVRERVVGGGVPATREMIQLACLRRPLRRPLR